MIALERFMIKVEMIPEHTCWEWVASKSTQGQALFFHLDKLTNASRVSYKLFKGPVPKGLEVCHTCDNPGCVRPEHLFLGTHLENMHDRDRKGRLKNGKGEKQLAKTHCPQGHVYDGQNTYRYKNSRQCVKCRKYHSKNRKRSM